MDVTTRAANRPDLPFLCGVDGHLDHHDLADVVSRGQVMLAEVDEVSVACLRWGLFWDEIPFMNLLWVITPWRGQGVGTSLVEAWEVEMRRRGHRLVLTSTSAAERAKHLYRRLGYVDRGCLMLPHEPTELILGKYLDEEVPTGAAGSTSGRS